MGYELNRIMKQYGVSTPGMASYTGTPPPSAPTAPTSSRPADDIGEADIKERQQAYDQQLSDFNAYTEDPYTYKANKGFVGYNTNNFKAPIRPLGDRPAGTGTGISAQAAYDKQLADFNAYTADPNILTEQMRKYGLDQKSYDAYKNTYQGRLQNTPMYAQGQFQNYATLPDSKAGQLDFSSNTLTPDIATNLMHRSMTTGAPTSEFDRYGGYDKVKALYDAGGGSYAKPTLPMQQTLPTKPVANTVADLYKMYLGREPEAGIPGFAPASTRPDFIQEAQRELSTKPTSGNQNLMNATGSYYGNQLKNPTYGAVPISTINDTPLQKSDYYLQQRNLGYTDADLRDATTSTFGKPAEGDWAQLTARAYPNYNQNIVDAYKSIGRSWEQGTIDAPGYNYWMNQLSSGAFDPKNLNSTFAQAAADEKAAADAVKAAAEGVNTVFAHGGSVHDLAEKYAQGGPVKTHYQTAGAVRLPSGYTSLEEEEDVMRRTPPSLAVVGPTNELPDKQQIDMMPPVAVQSVPEPRSVLAEIAAPAPAPVAVVPTPVPVAPKAAMPFGDERLSGIQALLATYGPKDSAYAADLKIARDRATADSNAFTKMLTDTMKSPEDAQSSKAEIYFRLAAAFGAPTKTGQFSENLGMVGKELGEFAKGKRASAKEKQLLGLEIQKLKMASSKEDLNTLRALAGEEMKDKRAIATELIKEYINSGKPQSAAGKQALDEGLVAGTPAYQKRVAEIGNLNVEAKMAQITSALSGVTTQAANLSVAQSRLDLDRERLEQQKSQQTKLTPQELKLKTEAEDLIASSKQSLIDLKQAYSLNPNSLAGGWLDKGQQFLSEAAGSKDPTIVNTRVLNNLLGSQGLAKLRATFGGSPTEGERAILLELEGIGAKTKDERGKIIKRAYRVLQDRQAREQARLDQINSGAYRTTTPLEGEIE